MASIIVGKDSVVMDPHPFFTTHLPDEVILIGKFSGLAEDVKVFAGFEHYAKNVAGFPLNILYFSKFDQVAIDDPDNASEFMERATRHIKKDVYAKGPTIIGNDVLVMYHATILSGVKIGDGAFIGAGSVVAKDVPPYAIVAGNPARVIKYRFSEEQIKALLLIRWWDWTDEEMKEFEEYFYDIDVFVPKALEKMKKEGRLPQNKGVV
ncbi:MAG: CatB-related O-acetyltransferase [Firmicutes bacterium]|nr:CatB-related O-acetyltransferase [Bacillota bacterium]